MFLLERKRSSVGAQQYQRYCYVHDDVSLTCFVLIWFCNHNCHLFIFIVLLFQAVNTFRKIEAAAQVKMYFLKVNFSQMPFSCCWLLCNFSKRLFTSFTFFTAYIFANITNTFTFIRFWRTSSTNVCS